LSLSCSVRNLRTLREVIESSFRRSLYTENGVSVAPVDLWKLLGGILLDAQKREGDAFGDSVLWSLRVFLNSGNPLSALLFLDAVDEVVQDRDPSRLLTGHRRGTWQDVKNYLSGSLNETEIAVLSELIGKGAIEGYEVVHSDVVDAPVFNTEPMKVLPFNVHTGWLRTAEIELPIELPSARFVVADESVSDEEQVRFLQQLSRTGSPVVLLCYRMDDGLAEDLGRGWRDGWCRVVPYTAVDANVSEEIRVNVLADTAWITGSSMCSYVSRRGLRDLDRGSKEISAAFPFVTVANSYVKFLAHSTRSGCRLRAGQLLSRLEAPDESAEILLQRAAYINGVEVQLMLPSGNRSVLPSSLDLGVSVYKTFMDGAAEWGSGESQSFVPFFAAMMAIEHAKPLKELLEVQNLELLG
jgi:hypothetical protein